MTSVDTLEAQLDRLFEAEYTFRYGAEPARAIATLEPPLQAFAIDWIQRVASAHSEIGYQFANRLVQALETMDPETVEAWALHAMDCYDQQGLHPALEIIRNLDDFSRVRRERAFGSVLEQQQGVLLGFLHGLSGRRLKLAEADTLYTDSETLFLPPVVALLENPGDNFQLYKAMIASLWAQVRFGTFRAPLAERLAASDDPQRLLALFRALEMLRLDAVVARELPGLAREQSRLRRALGEAPLPPSWEVLRRQVAEPQVNATRVLALAERLPATLAPYQARTTHGELLLDEVAACTAARLAREKQALRVRLKMLQDELEAQGGALDVPFGPTVPWTHVVVTGDAAERVVYVDGVRTASGAASRGPSSTFTLPSLK